MVLRSLLVVCLIGAGARTAIADDDAPSIDDTPHITVVGTASAQMVPDQAEIRLGVTIDKPTAGEAWEADAKLARDVIDAAKSAGVKPQAIGTTRVDLFQLYEPTRQPDGTSKVEPHGFRATQELSVRVSDLDTIGNLSGALIAKGANKFDGVHFSVSKADTIRDKLRGEAMRDARHQAEILAVAAGVKVGRLLQVERPDRPAGTPVQVKSNFIAGPPTMPVEPGTQTLSVDVEASFAIE